MSKRSFEDTIDQVTDVLKASGFGILTDIDIKTTLKTKLDVEFPKYRILGACNPPFAYAALQTEALAGLFLPCSVVVREREDQQVEVSAIDPAAAMQSVDNPDLQALALKIREKLTTVIQQI